MYRTPLDLNYGDWERYGSPILCRLCGASAHHVEPPTTQRDQMRLSWLRRWLPEPRRRDYVPGRSQEVDRGPLAG